MGFLDSLAQNNWGKRKDGTLKGGGWLGPLRRPDGRVSTELSVGVNLGRGEVEIPLLVPTLNKNEVEYLLRGGEPTREIMDKAAKHAVERMRQGMSPFKD